jgi:hypothetical protein
MSSKVIRCPQCGESRHIPFHEVYIAFEPELDAAGRVSQSGLPGNTALFACGHVHHLPTLVRVGQEELRAEYQREVDAENATRAVHQVEALERARAESVALEAAEVLERVQREERNRAAEERARSPEVLRFYEEENARLAAERLAQRKQEIERIRARVCPVYSPEEGFAPGHVRK